MSASNSALVLLAEAPLRKTGETRVERGQRRAKASVVDDLANKKVTLGHLYKLRLDSIAPMHLHACNLGFHRQPGHRDHGRRRSRPEEGSQEEGRL